MTGQGIAFLLVAAVFVIYPRLMVRAWRALPLAIAIGAVVAWARYGIAYLP